MSARDKMIDWLEKARNGKPNSRLGLDRVVRELGQKQNRLHHDHPVSIEIEHALGAHREARRSADAVRHLPTGGMRMSGRHWDNLGVKMSAGDKVYDSEQRLRQLHHKHVKTKRNPKG